MIYNQNWILPKGGPWRSVCGNKRGIAKDDIALGGFELLEDKKLTKAYIDRDLRKELGLLKGQLYIIVALDHILKNDDTRPIRFSSSIRDIMVCIEDLRKKIYDGERDRERTTRSSIISWKERLKLLHQMRKQFEREHGK